MKWILIIILITSVAILGCSPSGKAEQAPDPKAANDMDFDEAMGSDIDTSKWVTNYEAALETAKKTDRPVLVNFTGSDWCSWCIKLHKEVFSQDEFIAYAKENLVLLKLDFPRSIPQTAEEKSANAKLSNQYGVQGYPTILLINSEGKEIARTGYQPGGASAYVEHIKSLLAAKK